MLQPKKTKHRKMFKGRMKGDSQRGHTLAFGSYGIKTLENQINKKLRMCPNKILKQMTQSRPHRHLVVSPLLKTKMAFLGKNYLRS